MLTIWEHAFVYFSWKNCKETSEFTPLEDRDFPSSRSACVGSQFVFTLRLDCICTLNLLHKQIGILLEY